MTIIKPISDLRNKSRELAKACHETGQPIYITRNGEGDMVLMSLAAYERMEAQLELYRLLDEAETDERAGDRGVGVKTLRKRLAARRRAP